jgi:hypothetical protein
MPPEKQSAIVVKPWTERSNTLGFLPGKGNEQDRALCAILKQLPVSENAEIIVVGADGKARSVPADRLFVAQLSRGSFVRRAKGEWEATAQVRYWASSNDNKYLAQHIQGNVKFFGELLAYIDDDTRTIDLQKHAEEFGLYWTSPDQVHRRLGWLQSLNLLERWGFSKLVVTELGREFLNETTIMKPAELQDTAGEFEDDQIELSEPHPIVVEALANMSVKSLRKRKILIGYVPRGQKSAGRPSDELQVGALEATRNFVDLLDERTSAEELFRRASSQIGLKKSSFTQSMHTFRNMHVIDMVAYNLYGVTLEGKQFLTPGNEVDLIRFLHTRYRFVGEVLAALKDTRTVSELAAMAKNDFKCDQIDTSEVRTRLSFMSEAGMVQRIDWTRYRATALGSALADQLPLETPLRAEEGSEPVESTMDESRNTPRAMTSDIENLNAEIIRCSQLNEATSTEFEQVVARAFEALGFNAEHIGGSGKTDVLVTAELAEADRFSSIVDAKASATGVVGDNAIKFDALKDHRKMHGADYGLVVGPDFSGRVKKWASDNGFVLLTADELVGLVERHQAAPLSVLQLRDLFDVGKSSLDGLDMAYDSRGYENRLMGKIVSILADEASEEDPVAGGSISLDNMQYALRKELNPRPSREQITKALDILTSGILGGVVADGDKFKLIDSPSNIARRFRSIGTTMTDIIQSNRSD